MKDSMFNVVVFVDAKMWGQRTEEEVLTDWINPLSTHPQIRNVIIAGASRRFATFAKTPKIKITPGAVERQTLLDSGCEPGIEGVVRLNHSCKLRFPISHCLIDDALTEYAKQARGGYLQLDLSDLPYPYLSPEVLGRDAIQFLINHPDVPLDWNYVKVRHGDQIPMERGSASYKTRCEYLENPAVEYYTFPKFMALESSRLCNLRCTMCVTHSDFIDHSHLDKYPKHFDLKKYEWILDQMVPYKEYMSIAPQFQGEPFMSPHIKEMISYARGKGFCVGFTSNATLWNDEIIDFMIDQEVHSLCVSLDGATKETYEQVRVGANFDTVISNLNKLLTKKMERGVNMPHLSINMTLMPENRHQEEKMLQDWLGKANLVSINNTCINHVVPEKFHEPERYPCPFLWEGVHIITNGDVIACCRDSDYEEVMGNCYEAPMMEIWNNEKYRRFRKLHVLKRWDEIPMCARCDTWMCKTKKTIADGDRMIFQYPFYRQHFSMRNGSSDSLRGMLDELWGAVKNSTKKIATSLISINPLRQAS